MMMEYDARVLEMRNRSGQGPASILRDLDVCGCSERQYYSSLAYWLLAQHR
jgi:hypothetical protein